jgi:hypothetical protein
MAKIRKMCIEHMVVFLVLIADFVGFVRRFT